MPKRSGEIRILLADDDEDDCLLFADVLTEIEIPTQLSWVSNGKELMERLAGMGTDTLPEMIFLDMNMPKLNGKQVLKEIRKSTLLFAIPVIMYSTSFAPRDIEDFTREGAVHHLLKPSRFDELCRALKQVLSTDWKPKEDRDSL